MGRLVSGEPDESHLRLRQQVERRLGHAQAGPQHRHQQRGSASVLSVAGPIGVITRTSVDARLRVAS